MMRPENLDAIVVGTGLAGDRTGEAGGSKG